MFSNLVFVRKCYTLVLSLLRLAFEQQSLLEYVCFPSINSSLAVLLSSLVLSSFLRFFFVALSSLFSGLACVVMLSYTIRSTVD